MIVHYSKFSDMDYFFLPYEKNPTYCLEYNGVYSDTLVIKGTSYLECRCRNGERLFSKDGGKPECTPDRNGELYGERWLIFFFKKLFIHNLSK